MKDLKESVREIVFNNMPKSLGKNKKHQTEWLCKSVAKDIAERTADQVLALFEKEIADLKEDAAHKEMDWFTADRKVKTLEKEIARYGGQQIFRYIKALELQLAKYAGRYESHLIIKSLEEKLAKSREGLEKIMKVDITHLDEKDLVWDIAKSTLTEIGG